MDQLDGKPNQSSAVTPEDRAAQRRLLLRGAAAGGALVGVAAPLTAHATTRPHCVKSSKNYNATASAVGSMLGSSAGTNSPVAGHNCSHYRNSGNWTGSTWNNGCGRTLNFTNCADTSAPTSSRLRFFQVFNFSYTPATTDTRYYTCAYILANLPSSNEAVWLTAMFNSNKRVPFTYTPAQVIDLYNSRNPLMGGATQAGLNDKALQLFRDYLSDLL